VTVPHLRAYILHCRWNAAWNAGVFPTDHSLMFAVSRIRTVLGARAIHPGLNCLPDSTVARLKETAT